MQKVFRLPVAALGLFALLFLFSCQKTDLNSIPANNTNASTNDLSSADANEKAVPNEILVKFKAGTSQSKKDQILSNLNARVSEKILTKAMQRSGDNEGIHLLKVSSAALDAISKAKGFGEVVYAEPNFIYTHNATSNDPYFTNGSLWGMYGDATLRANPSFGSQAEEAWAAGRTGSNTVYVGIIDEGYMYTHLDLAANAGTNPGETAGDKFDNDGNGLVDDVYGWDFAGNNSSVFDGADDDHGTHVAGTIGAVGRNSIGVAGVCWNVKLLNAKFLGSMGGTTANAIKAVDYFTDLKTRHNLNIVATNNSWGGGGFSQSLKNAIDRADAAGILFIAAAGNSGTNNDLTANYPSNYPNANVIAVAAITNIGALASYSNYGATQVDLGAPGSGILSTVPVSSKGKAVSGYATYNGTSMATPHVTGAAALYAAYHPGATAAQIKAAILGSTVPTASLAGKCATGGRLNVSGF